jgi:uncharacterized protein YjbJ (UPF0337 family)
VSLFHTIPVSHKGNGLRERSVVVADKAKGKAKEAAGAVTGDEDQKAEGQAEQKKAEAEEKAEQGKGKGKDVVGGVTDTVGGVTDTVKGVLKQ